MSLLARRGPRGIDRVEATQPRLAAVRRVFDQLPDLTAGKNRERRAIRIRLTVDKRNALEARPLRSGMHEGLLLHVRARHPHLLPDAGRRLVVEEALPFPTLDVAP